MLSTQDFKNFAQQLGLQIAPFNYKIADAFSAGKPGKRIKSMREFRLQLINKTNNTSETLIKNLENIIKTTITLDKDVTFNKISPNSSKFPSFSFQYKNQMFDIVIAQGANKGEQFEINVVRDMELFFHAKESTAIYEDLINQLNRSNKHFAERTIVKVSKRVGSTKKQGVPLEKLNEIIGDLYLIDSLNHKWYISLKDVGGAVVSSWPDAGTLFNSLGDLQVNSKAADFLKIFGVDLNLVQEGFDQRHSKQKVRIKVPTETQSTAKIKDVFERVWGINYFYVRKTSTSWKVFWLDRQKLNTLVNNIKVTQIKYPSKTSKQITIFCENMYEKYIIEVRNSSGGEFPNDIKIKLSK